MNYIFDLTQEQITKLMPKIERFVKDWFWEDIKHDIKLGAEGKDIFIEDFCSEVTFTNAMFDIFQKRNSEQIVFFEKKSDKEIICKINALKHFNVKEETFKDYLDGKITVKQMLGAQPWTNVSKLN